MRRHVHSLPLETLESRRLLAVLALTDGPVHERLETDSPFVISELMASNTRVLPTRIRSSPTAAFTGESQFFDWIEIQNSRSTPGNIGGYYLTDDATNFTKWQIPVGTVIPPAGYLVIVASGADLTETTLDEQGLLHTNFRLDREGEYLGLVSPDGWSIIDAFSPQFPSQLSNASYGTAMDFAPTPLVTAESEMRVHVPGSANSSVAWRGGDEPFDDAEWKTGNGGVGFDVDGLRPTADQLAGYWPWDGTLQDSSDHSRTANASGATFDSDTPPTSTGGKSLSLNGLSSQIDLGRLATTHGTLSLWIKPEDVGAAGGNRRLLSQVEGPTHQAGALAIDPNGNLGDGSLWIWSGQTWLRLTPNGLLRANEWQHLALVTTGTTATLYVDAIEQATVATRFDFEARNMVLGAPFLNVHGSPFIGLIDDVSVWHEQLAPAQIARLAAGTPATRSGSYLPLIGTNLQSDMLDTNSTAWTRSSFQVDDPAEFSGLELHVQYDDGFAAYLNGHLLTSRNAPESLVWNSAALTSRSDQDAIREEIIDISASLPMLESGSNILAFHLLNASVADGDLLLQSELVARRQQTAAGELRHFARPTPGSPNGVNESDVGPIIRTVSEPNGVYEASSPLQVTAAIDSLFFPIDQVQLHYRTMFGSEQVVRMWDDGAHGDGHRDDGIFAGTIPAGVAAAGNMLRYRVTAVDSMGQTSRWPLFNDPHRTPEYLGTVALAAENAADLAELFWFSDESAAATQAGARGSVYFAGKFYDNILIHGRGAGGSGAGLKFEFNAGFPFHYDDNHPPVEEFNTRSSAGTLEELLALEVYRDAGAPHSVVFPMRTYVNGRPAGVVTFIEQPDATLLERNGLDPDGALFKLFNSLTHPVERSYTFYRNDNTKRTREYDPSWDLDQLVAGVDPGNPDRHLYVMDQINVASVINYLAATVITGDFDHETHNYFAYRDNQGTGEWQLIPWDRNLAFATADSDPTSHPFLGSSAYVHPPWANLEGKSNEQWNRLTDAIYEHPTTRAMFLRRLRTLMDVLLQPPETPAEALRLENRVGELSDLIRPLDPARAASIPSILAYLAKRRRHLYVTHSVDNIPHYAHAAGIPDAQTVNPVIRFGRIEPLPASGNEYEEFIELVNPGDVAVDLSGWRVGGDVDLTMAPGTVIVAGGSLFLSPDVRALRGRSAGPSGGQGLHMQGNYDRLLVNSGGAVQLYAADGALIASAAYEGQEPSILPSLRVSEVHYHPADPTAAETSVGFGQADDFEFIELVNVGQQTIGLADARLVQAAVGTTTQGVQFAFSEGQISQLEPGARALVVEDARAFAFRYGDDLPVAGEWNGSLSNNRELLTIQEGSRLIQRFSYDDDWHPSSDGGGSSLESADPTDTDQANWSRAAGWRASEHVGGTPGFGPPGDLDGNHRADSLDIDRIYAGLRKDHAPPHHDLNGDGAVDRADVEELVFAILGTTYGDANLDGVVDLPQDGIPFLMALGQHAAVWSQGEFDGDGVITASGDGALLLAALSADVAAAGEGEMGASTHPTEVVAGQRAFAEWGLPDPWQQRHKSTWQ